MAEYIDREALPSCKECIHNGVCGLQERCFDIELQLKEFGCDDFKATADVVEVVRCKDCKHWLKDVVGCIDFIGRCEWANYMVGANGYCVYGEKMDGKGE